jgi:predicted RNase H-like HicB family nuclease
MRKRRSEAGRRQGLNLPAARDNPMWRLNMKIKIVVHEAEEGGFWAEVPAIPGCATQGDSMDELMQNLHEAIEGCLSIEVTPPEPGGSERMLELRA